MAIRILALFGTLVHSGSVMVGHRPEATKVLSVRSGTSPRHIVQVFQFHADCHSRARSQHRFNGPTRSVLAFAMNGSEGDHFGGGGKFAHSIEPVGAFTRAQSLLRCPIE